MEFHDLLAGFVRIHVLHHAAEGEVYGQWLIEELARHGYRISPGTLYPMLQAMEDRGYLTSREDSDGRLGRRRKVYTATKEGQRGLEVARERLRELTGEVSRKRKRRAQQRG
ncbi:MAG: helix-turn-helix transcriptional regulator [Acetobacteraceae bacterium]|nr:helix-turn-helix transcriptional regulator [Acetobacteraceae bacterium]